MKRKKVVLFFLWGLFFLLSCSLGTGELSRGEAMRKVIVSELDRGEIIETLLQYIEKGQSHKVDDYLAADAIWNVAGDPATNPLAGVFSGTAAIEDYLELTDTLMEFCSIDIENQTPAGDIITTILRKTGNLNATGAAFDLEFIYTWEFDEGNRITAVTVLSNQVALAALFTSGGQGRLVSNINISPEAQGLYYYYLFYLKDYFKIAPYWELRALLDTPILPEDLPPDAILTPVTIAGVPGEMMSTPESHMQKLILYLHGGAFVAGDMAAMRAVTYQLAKSTCIPVLAINYRRPPEDLFPAAPADCLAVYQALLASYYAGNLAIAGESAGGNLVFTTLLQARDQDLPLPAAAVAISPWLDLTNSSGSFTTNAASDAMLSIEVLDKAVSYYLTGVFPPLPPEPDTLDPLASPLYADVSGLPPVYLTASSEEILLDDSLQMFSKLESAGAEVTLEIGAGMIHVWPNQQIPEGIKTTLRIAEFLKTKLGGCDCP